MIVEQGTVLDSVEYNVTLAARELESGVGELKVAQRWDFVLFFGLWSSDMEKDWARDIGLAG